MYVYEQVPFGADPVMADYLARQLQAVQIAFENAIQVPIIDTLPASGSLGQMVFLRNDGFYGYSRVAAVNPWGKFA